MPTTLQVIYPAREDAVFDYDYYLETHLPLVQEHWGEVIEGVEVTKGLASGPDVPPAYLAIATITFPDMEALDKAMSETGGVIVDDVPNFTNVRPQILIGDLIHG
ncbi:EthD family reductase [Phaeobacter sp. 11ANDIMAR09]|uniref:EthD family reductase n=1 Tax=Phaeobacter sp. 11ANDIMAR09 TaxID=1225647 RepID=UPI0006C8C0B0|nr:EthD family reductase [Phaeobacter sp. 11ANDIMAR09]KPD13539.1 ethyl tert-butyl ether degradation protein EthD [Phaeobacter sp. 11ANDIMAR09]